MNTLRVLGVFLLLASIQSFGQIKSSSNIQINLSVVKGINLSAVNGSLNFDEILSPQSSTKITKNPDKGLLLEVKGQPGREVFVQYSSTLLSNENWVKNFGGQIGSMTFQPNVESSLEPVYDNTVKVNQSSSFILENSDGYGKHFLWIGGDVLASENSPMGDYTGSFSLTVTY